MNKMAIGFLALILLCVFMWLVSAVRRRQRQGTRMPARRGPAGTDPGFDATLVATMAAGSGVGTHGHHHHLGTDGGASSAHGGHSFADGGASVGHSDGGGGGGGSH